MQNYTCTDDGILWINADGCWLKTHKSKKNIEVKTFVFYTGREVGRFGKSQLTGRTMKQFINVPFNEMMDAVGRIVNQYTDVREIRVVGDGAKWIKNAAKDLAAVYYIDKFHTRKALKDLVGKEKYSRGLELISMEWNSPRELKLALMKLMADENSGEINEKNLRLLGYIVNNQKHYIKSVSDNTTNSIEAMQAHFQCKYMKNQRKGFSLEIMNKLITSFYNFANKGWEFTHFKKEPVTWSIGHSNTGKNVPVFNYGLSSSRTYQMLKHIINS